MSEKIKNAAINQFLTVMDEGISIAYDQSLESGIRYRAYPKEDSTEIYSAFRKAHKIVNTTLKNKIIEIVDEHIRDFKETDEWSETNELNEVNDLWFDITIKIKKFIKETIAAEFNKKCKVTLNYGDYITYLCEMNLSDISEELTGKDLDEPPYEYVPSEPDYSDSETSDSKSETD